MKTFREFKEQTDSNDDLLLSEGKISSAAVITKLRQLSKQVKSASTPEKAQSFLASMILWGFAGLLLDRKNK